MNTNAYLERLNYRGSLEPTISTLRRLQLAHLYSVPFENLSGHTNEQIELTEDWLFDKIVGRRRGGFCYELNGLFAGLLRELGFDVTLLSAGVANAEGVFGPAFDHLTLLVELDQRYLVDVGFGDSFREPLLLDSRTVQPQFGRGYQIVEDGNKLLLMEQKPSEEWRAQFRFPLMPYQLTDYAAMCWFHQFSAESHFTKKRICTLAMPTGRKTLSDDKFIVTTLQGERDEQPVANEATFTKLLFDQFGIKTSDVSKTSDV